MPRDAKIHAQLKKFGASVRRERIVKGITQEKLAALDDLNIRSVQKIEAAQINVLVTTAMRIQKALDCPWGKLMS